MKLVANIQLRYSIIERVFNNISDLHTYLLYLAETGNPVICYDYRAVVINN